MISLSSTEHGASTSRTGGPPLEVDLPDEAGGSHGYEQARQRWQDDDGTCWYHVAWPRLDETSARLDHFPADQVRPDPTDWEAADTQRPHRRT